MWGEILYMNRCSYLPAEDAGELRCVGALPYCGAFEGA
jgi:hypothetical protein